MAGLSYIRLIRRLEGTGWRVELIYLALPDVETAKLRVAERVSHGGHEKNLFGAYASLVDRTVCFLNSGETPELVFTQQGEQRAVLQPAVMQSLEARRRT